MARFFVTSCVLLFGLSGPVAAQNYTNCTKSERAIIQTALARSKRLALTAATAVGPNPVFERWFGKFTPAQGEIVRRNLKSVVTAIRTGAVTAACINVNEKICEEDTFAFVVTDEPYLINLCPAFFDMDTMADLTTETAAAGNGTRAGTIIHEISHFDRVASTDDICYSREDCTDMAQDRPADALMNADSYQYFAEDVTFYGVTGEVVIIDETAQ